MCVRDRETERQRERGSKATVVVHKESNKGKREKEEKMKVPLKADTLVLNDPSSRLVIIKILLSNWKSLSWWNTLNFVSSLLI
jgi:hypothetical protein